MEKTPSEELFTKIITDDLMYISDAIKDKTIESYYLDFKSLEEDNYTGKRKLTISEKKNYAKAISAFGNSEGGVIVWGIKTGSAEQDYAESAQPIKGVSNFVSLLEGYTSLVTSPQHPKVTTKIIFEDKSADIGYAVTHIEKSNKRPFQVINENDFRYYIRAGSSSLPASDIFVRSLFGREPQPNVFMTYGVPPAVDFVDGVISVQVGVILHNGGENVAKNVNGYVHVGGRDMGVQINQNTIKDFSYNTNSISGMKVGFVANTPFILGVEQEVQPLFIHINVAKPITENGIMIATFVNADDQMSYRFKKIISKEDVEKAYDKFVADRNSEEFVAVFLQG